MSNIETVVKNLKGLLTEHGYALLEYLGSGGESYVCLVDSKTGKRVVKVSRKDYPSNSTQGLNKEIEVAREVSNSPFIVQLHDFFVAENRLFTVWDYASGGTLKDQIMSGKQLTRVDCCKLLKTFAKGLDYLHCGMDVPFAHGDIKPENLLFFESGFLKIGDLGIARILDSATALGLSKAIYSEGYYLPSVHDASATIERDLFGFAVTYIESRLGKHPFGSDLVAMRRNLKRVTPDEAVIEDLEGIEHEYLLPMLEQSGDLSQYVGGLAQLTEKIAINATPKRDIAFTHSVLDISQFLDSPHRVVQAIRDCPKPVVIPLCSFLLFEQTHPILGKTIRNSFIPEKELVVAETTATKPLQSYREIVDSLKKNGHAPKVVAIDQESSPTELPQSSPSTEEEKVNASRPKRPERKKRGEWTPGSVVGRVDSPERVRFLIDTCSLMTAGISEFVHDQLIPWAQSCDEAIVAVPKEVARELMGHVTHGNSKKKSKAYSGLRILKELKDAGVLSMFETGLAYEKQSADDLSLIHISEPTRPY